MLNPAPVSRLNVGAQIFVLLLRVAVGWHFLYEGVYKFGKMRESQKFAELASSLGENAKWSGYSVAKGYLAEATGPFADMFREWGSSPATLHLMDQMVIAGLILCGVCLMLGLFTRLAGLGAMSMLAMFYISAPPWAVQQITSVREEMIEKPVVVIDGRPTPATVKGGKLYDEKGDALEVSGKLTVQLPDGKTATGTAVGKAVRVVRPVYEQEYLSGLPGYALPGGKPVKPGPTEGNYLLVNKNLIEFLAVALLLALNAGFVCGLDLLVRRYATARLFGGSAPAGAAPAAAPDGAALAVGAQSAQPQPAGAR